MKTRLAALALLSALPVLAGEPEKQVDLLFGVRIPMRDGVKLNANLFKLHGFTGRAPVLFALTPYTTESAHELASWLAQQGYVTALVECRGRGDSEGTFEPFERDGQDGFDAVEWLASQPFSDGQVGMFGGSYLGFVQWTTLKEGPPHLKTIVPVASVRPGYDFPISKNIGQPYVIQWLTLTSGRTVNRRLFGDKAVWKTVEARLGRDHRAFKDLPQIAGVSPAAFGRWLEHAVLDAYWDAMVPSPDQLKAAAIPILTITGHYDDDQPGALEYEHLFEQNAPAEARAKHYVVVGPWDHSGTWKPTKEHGGLKFADAAAVDMKKLHQEWFDWTLRVGKKPEFLKDQLAYYVMGADQWKYAHGFAGVRAAPRVFYLSSDGSANDVFRSGSLSGEKSRGAPFDAYAYDPLDVRAAELMHSVPEEQALIDQTQALNLFGAGLVYHSPPFTQDTEVTGAPRVVAYLSMDVPDTDLEVDLSEVLSDGRSIYLAGDFQRARYRESLRREKLVKLGAVEKYEFRTHWFSRRIAKGSRLRLIVKSSNSFSVQRNYNGGGNVADESGKDARIAHVKLWHDAAHASFIELPVVNAETPRAER